MKATVSVIALSIGVLAVVAGFMGFYSGTKQAHVVQPGRPPAPLPSVAPLSSPTPTAQPQVAGATAVSLAAATTVVAKGQGVLLDVRTAAAYKAKHPKGAVNFDAALIEDGELPKIDLKKPVYIYGPDAARNQSVATILMTAGYAEVATVTP